MEESGLNPRKVPDAMFILNSTRKNQTSHWNFKAQF